MVHKTLNTIQPGEIVLFQKDESVERGNDLKRLLQFFRYCKMPGVLNLTTIHQDNHLLNYLGLRENIQFGCHIRGNRPSDFEKFLGETTNNSLERLLALIPDLELVAKKANGQEKLIVQIVRGIYHDSKYLFCNFSGADLDFQTIKIISETLFIHAKLNKKFLIVNCKNLFPLECFDKMIRQNSSGHFEINKFKYSSDELLMRAKNFRQRLVLFGNPLSPSTSSLFLDNDPTEI